MNLLGSSDGIGKETAFALSKMNAKTIIMACRESEKAKKALEEVRDKHPSNKEGNVLEFLDLSDLSSVKSFVDRLTEKNVKLDILINNAGIIINDRKVTKDGFEMQVIIREIKKVKIGCSTKLIIA